MRYSGDGRALVPRTDSSVRTSVQCARAPGGGGALESTWPRLMRASRELYGCDLALAATLFPRRAFARSVRRGEHGGL